MPSQKQKFQAGSAEPTTALDGDAPSTKKQLAPQQENTTHSLETTNAAVDLPYVPNPPKGMPLSLGGPPARIRIRQVEEGLDDNFKRQYAGGNDYEDDIEDEDEKQRPRKHTRYATQANFKAPYFDRYRALPAGEVNGGRDDNNADEDEDDADGLGVEGVTEGEEGDEECDSSEEEDLERRWFTKAKSI